MKFKNKKGFTLIELVAVMSIIAILLLMATPRVLGNTGKANEAKIVTDVGIIESAARIYNSENYSYPIGIPVDVQMLKTYADEGKVVTVNGKISYSEITDMDINEVDMDLIKNYVRVYPEGYFYIGESGIIYYSMEKI